LIVLKNCLDLINCLKKTIGLKNCLRGKLSYTKKFAYIEKLFGFKTILLHILKDVGMKNEASSESVRLVIRPIICPLSIRPVVRTDIKG
jgi:hypothetical protein